MAALAEELREDRIALAGLPMPLTLRLPVALSDEDLFALSRRIEPFQLERNAGGELEIMSPVRSAGSVREAFVIRMLGNWADEHGGVCLSSSGGVTLPDSSMRSPDTAWISDARWNALTPEEQNRYAPVCPDFVIEIRSESDARRRLEEKMEMWVANGAQLAWMIDPFAADVTVYRPGQSPESFARPEWVEAERVVPGFRLQVSRLWAQ